MYRNSTAASFPSGMVTGKAVVRVLHDAVAVAPLLYSLLPHSSPTLPSCISNALTWHASGTFSLRSAPLIMEGLTPPPSGEIMPSLPSEVNYGQSGSHIER